MSDFLDKLKSAVDNGEFNSEVAKKINDIDELVNVKIVNDDLKLIDKLDDVTERSASEDVVKLSVEEITEANTEYERKMSHFKKIDFINGSYANLVNIDNVINQSIEDIINYIGDIESQFENEISEDDPMITQLVTEIERIKLKYKSIN